MESLEELAAGMAIPFGGNRFTRVTDALAAAFAVGDRLIVVQETGDLLHIPAATWETAAAAVDLAVDAFGKLATVSDAAITDFYLGFARRLEDDTVFEAVAEANRSDVQAALERGRSTTRLELSDGMRSDMAEALRIWSRTPRERRPSEQIDHDGWRVELVPAPVGPIGFVFEGRPNVFADATGVLRFGNSVVFRIGSDALGTARALMEHCLRPSLADAGLPPGSVSLVDSPVHAAGWAMFSDDRLALAVARGSGAAVTQLGAVARQSGIPVSLHGTGGAWMVMTESADAATIESVVLNSLDRKVCNTLNTVVVVGNDPEIRLDAVFSALARAADRRQAKPRAHLGPTVSPPTEWGGTMQPIEPSASGTEWEWEDDPEITILTTETMQAAIELFNRHSPRFVVSLISTDAAEHERFFEAVDAPFVGNGFTRWVDGQYALGRPELGLSNWQYGRLLGRAGVLSGDSIFTLRARATQDHPDLGR